MYNDQRKAGNLNILCIGKKGYDFFRKNYTDCNVINTHVELFNDLSFPNVSLVVDEIMDAFTDETYDHVDVAYGQFKNAGTQFPQMIQFIPVKKVDRVAAESKAKVSKADYIFEPGKEELLDQLVPDILRTSFLKFLLDTHASEHGARMTAMDKATDNADELLKELKINYNKARQEAITNELSEIVGGAAALGG
jgi:F-type H+-transporting ATPase subunit gamma